MPKVTSLQNFINIEGLAICRQADRDRRRQYPLSASGRAATTIIGKWWRRYRGTTAVSATGVTVNLTTGVGSAGLASGEHADRESAI